MSKGLSITGIVLASLGLLVFVGDTSGDIGHFQSWLFLVSAFLLGYSITILVKK